MSDLDYKPRGSTVVITNAVLLSFTAIFVFVRLYVRVFLLNQVGIDDVLIWVASVFGFLLSIVEIMMTKHGLGLHVTDVPDAEFEKFLMLNFVSALAYIWAFVLIKLSFAVFYLRVIPNLGFRRLNNIIIAILSAQGIEETFVVCFSCTPITRFWKPSTPGSCLNLLRFYYISFGIKLLTDIVLFVEPIPTLLHLKLPWVKRIGLVVMFSLGLLTCVISIIRATYLNDTSSDVTWRLVDPIDWSTAEVCSLIICACIPYVRNLLAEIPYISQALGLSSNHSKGYPSNYGARTGQDTSIALQTQRTYIQSRNLKAGHGGVTTGAAAATSHHTTIGGGNGDGRIRATESTEEIFPNYIDRQGGIVVSTDVQVAVEGSQSQSRSSFSEP